MARYVNRISDLFSIVAVFVAISMVTIIIASIFMRYVAGSPIRFAEELVGIAFACIVFMMIPTCEANGAHIRVDIIVSRLSVKWKKIAKSLDRLLLSIFCLAFAYLSFKFTHTSYIWDARASASGILLYPWMAVMPISCVLTVLVAVIHIRKPPAETESEISGATRALLAEDERAGQ